MKSRLLQSRRASLGPLRPDPLREALATAARRVHARLQAAIPRFTEGDIRVLRAHYGVGVSLRAAARAEERSVADLEHMQRRAEVAVERAGDDACGSALLTVAFRDDVEPTPFEARPHARLRRALDPVLPEEERAAAVRSLFAWTEQLPEAAHWLALSAPAEPPRVRRAMVGFVGSQPPEAFAELGEPARASFADALAAMDTTDDPADRALGEQVRTMLGLKKLDELRVKPVDSFTVGAKSVSVNPVANLPWKEWTPSNTMAFKVDGAGSWEVRQAAKAKIRPEITWEGLGFVIDLIDLRQGGSRAFGAETKQTAGDSATSGGSALESPITPVLRGEARVRGYQARLYDFNGELYVTISSDSADAS